MINKTFISPENKFLLTVEEAVAYSNIGEKTLRQLIKEEKCPFRLIVGTKYLIKRTVFEEWLLKTDII